jgi:hypothetical protein
MESDLPKNLSNARKLFRINLSLFLLTIFIIVFAKNIFKIDNALVDALTGLPLLIVPFVTVFGLFYSWRSLRNNEGYSAVRMKYFFLHAFFCLIILVMVLAVIKDIKQLF